MYGHHGTLGRAAIKMIAMLAAAVFLAWLFNRPNGDLGPAINMTPATTGASTPR